MSGPKVINVVTRQEVIDICQAAIAEVDYALSEWQRIMDRNMIVAAGDLARFMTGRNALRQLLKADQFLDVQKAAPGLVAAIHSNVQQQLAVHDSQAAQEQRQERSHQFSAEAVLARCREMSVVIPVDCVRALTDAAAGRAVDAQVVQRAISQATSALYATEQSTAFTKQRDLAEVLGATGESTNAQEVLRAAEDSLVDPRIRRISSQLVELTSFGEDATASSFRSRLETVLQAEAAGEMCQRGLLLDSLEVEMAPALKQARHIHELRIAIGVEFATARALGDLEACQADLAAAEKQLDQENAEEATTSLAKARDIRAQRNRCRAAQASREAILQGLKDLGYAVEEGMATQLAAKKQLVVQHPAKPGVAVELTGTGDGGRLQARMVALQGVSRGAGTDKQVEEKWCTELQSLQASITQAGGALLVEKALAAGAIPMKIVAIEEDEYRAQIFKERKL
ncbi:MAG: hypothetical protein NTW75_00195 [Planctomycetales bacterium]|nr:hypothetical protein [Planctomycetales bacterium]